MKERLINIVSSKLKIDRLYYKNQPRLHIISKGLAEFDPHIDRFSSSVKILQQKNTKQKQSAHNLPRVNFKGQQEVSRNNVRIKTSYYPSTQKSNDKERKNKRAGTIYISKSKDQKTKKKIEEDRETKVDEIFEKQIQKLIESRLIHKDQSNYIIPAEKFISILEYLHEILNVRPPKSSKRLHTLSQQTQSLPKIDPYKTSMSQLHPIASRISEFALKTEHLSEEQISDEIISMKIKEVDLIEEDLKRKKEYLQELNRVIEQQEASRQQLSKQLMKILNEQQLVKSLKNKGYLKSKEASAYEKNCKQYIDAERYMFDYANYLENNELAISFDFDEGIFKEEKIKILNRMSQMVEFLDSLNDQSHRALKIKLFIQDLHSFHLDQERQILKVCHLKTHSIKCFIRNTRYWLKNWKFKQDLLTHFKQLFAINSHKVSCCFTELRLIAKKDQQMASLSMLVAEMDRVFKQMVQYFTLGNSFY